MTDLIVSLTKQKGAFEHAKKVIEDGDWQNIYIFTADDIGKELFQKKVEIIKIDLSKTISQLSIFIKDKLTNKLSDLEVALNIIAGSGKEHTAIISAILKLGYGIRLVVLTPDGITSV